MIEPGKVYLTKYGAGERVYLLCMIVNLKEDNEIFDNSLWYCLILDTYEDQSKIGTIVKRYISNKQNEIKHF